MGGHQIRQLLAATAVIVLATVGVVSVVSNLRANAGAVPPGDEPAGATATRAEPTAAAPSAPSPAAGSPSAPSPTAASPTAPGGTVAAQRSDAVACPPPPVLPTYLPWLDPGEQLPPPTVSSGDPELGDTSQVSWWQDDDAPPDRSYYVAVRLMSEPAGTGGGDRTDIVVDGVAGVRGEGAAPGDVWMGWSLGGTSCNLLELELTSSGALTTAQAQRELMRIAGSFVPAGDARAPEPGDGGS